MHRNRSIATATVLTFLCVSAALLAAPVVQAGAPFAQLTGPSPAVKLTMDDEHVIREFLQKAQDTPKLPKEIEMKIGTEVPAEVPLQPFPDEVHNKLAQLKGHRFFIHDDRIFIVDSTRAIAEIIPQTER